MRACVRVCVWSQFPPSAALPDWGSERPLSVPGVPSLLTPSSFPFTRTPSFRQACPKLRLAGTGKAVTASVSTRPFYPAPPLLAPCGPPTRRSLSWSSPAAVQPAPIPATPPVASLVLHLAFPHAFQRVCHSFPSRPEPGPSLLGAVVRHSPLCESCYLFR